MNPSPPPTSVYAANSAALALHCSIMESGSAVVSASFEALPEEALRAIFLALPVDARAQAACVCRFLRAFLADPTLWQVLDLTPAGGVARARLSEALVHGAVARAAGRLRVLSFSRVPLEDVEMLLTRVVLSDGAELQEMTSDVYTSPPLLRTALAAAPRLQTLSASVMGGCTDLLPVLRNDPPYGPLRVGVLHAAARDDVAADVALAFAAAVAAHESLKVLILMFVHVARGLNAVIAAAAERRVAQLSLDRCMMDAESIPALARLLHGGSLTKLTVICDDFPDVPEASLLELCAAIRACRTLTHLKLNLRPVGHENDRAITELVCAAATLPALSELDLCKCSMMHDAAAAGQALGALLAANLPSLRMLRVNDCQLGDHGLGLLLDGIEANTHLRDLDCRDNDVSVGFQRDMLFPLHAMLVARRELDA